MSNFWAYPYADVLAIITIASISLVCFVSARLFVKNYGK
jgi:hypothetical protein